MLRTILSGEATPTIEDGSAITDDVPLGVAT
jgi:hypothetical protein